MSLSSKVDNTPMNIAAGSAQSVADNRSPLATLHLIVLLAALLATGVLLGACSDDAATGPPIVQPLPDSSGIYSEVFSDPETACKGCHPTHYEEWSISMHAYSFVDPVFFRLNEIGQERSNGQLGSFCTDCHSPIASRLGEVPPNTPEASLSKLARAGVSCDVCHKAESWRPGHAIDGFRLDDAQIGTIQDPMPNGFHSSRYDADFSRSGVCEGCHDIVNPLGVRVERTSTEHDASLYPGQGIFCQTCHMLTYTGQAAIGAPERGNLHRHTMAGVDVPLTDFPGRDKMIELVEHQLTRSITLTVNAPTEATRSENLRILVDVFNTNVGHSIPSGSVFERQMWVEVIARDADTDEELYSSGTLDPNGDLLDENSEFVKSGDMQPDLELALFNGIPKKNGETTSFFWEAHEIVFRLIPALEGRTSIYNIPAQQLEGVDRITLAVRVLFRAFPPHFLRKIDLPELVERVPQFTMDEYQTEIQLL